MDHFISSDHGALGQVKIDGMAVGKPIDTYSDIPRDGYLLSINPAMRQRILGEVQLKAGEHTAEIEIVGSDSKAKGSELMIDCLTVNKKDR